MTADEMEEINKRVGRNIKRRPDFVDSAHIGRSPYHYYGITHLTRGNFQTEQGCTFSSIETAVVAVVISRSPGIFDDIIETLAHDDERTDVAALRYYIEKNEFAGSIRSALANCRLIDKENTWLQHIHYSEIIATTLGHTLEQAQNTLAARLRLR